MNKDKNVLSDWQEENNPLDQKTAKKLVWRSRLSLTFTVVRTIIVIFFIYAIYMVSVSMFYHFSGKEATFERFVTTVIETRVPGISVDKSAISDGDITPFLTKKTTMTLYRDVGEWDVVVGKVDAEKKLFGELKLDFQYNHQYLNESVSPPYAIAADLLGVEAPEQRDQSTQLEQLKMVDDGHVVQLQFSTMESMEPESLINMLESYDLRVLEMPVYGGELTKITENIGYTSNEYATFTQTLKLRGQVTYDEDNRLSSYTHGLDNETIGFAKEQLQQDLEWLITADRYAEQDIDEQRLQYIEENGILVFGAVVTGPVREVEKLVEENAFHQTYIGGIEVWNWW